MVAEVVRWVDFKFDRNNARLIAGYYQAPACQANHVRTAPRFNLRPSLTFILLRRNHHRPYTLVSTAFTTTAFRRSSALLHLAYRVANATYLHIYLRHVMGASDLALPPVQARRRDGYSQAHRHRLRAWAWDRFVVPPRTGKEVLGPSTPAVL